MIYAIRPFYTTDIKHRCWINDKQSKSFNFTLKYEFQQEQTRNIR